MMAMIMASGGGCGGGGVGGIEGTELQSSNDGTSLPIVMVENTEDNHPAVVLSLDESITIYPPEDSQGQSYIINKSRSQSCSSDSSTLSRLANKYDEEDEDFGGNNSFSSAPHTLFLNTKTTTEFQQNYLTITNKLRERGGSLELPRVCIHCCYLEEMDQDFIYGPERKKLLNKRNFVSIINNMVDGGEQYYYNTQSSSGSPHDSSANSIGSPNSPSSSLLPFTSSCNVVVVCKTKNFLQVPDIGSINKPRSTSVDHILYRTSTSSNDDRRSSLECIHVPDKPRAESLQVNSTIPDRDRYHQHQHHHQRPQLYNTKRTCYNTLKSRALQSGGGGDAIQVVGGGGGGNFSLKPSNTEYSLSTLQFPQRNTLSWEECVSNGDHLWTDTNKSGDFCYMPENECTRNGAKKKCIICKMIIHTGCILNLTSPCRLTFREAGARDYREGKIHEAFTAHHWVHRKRLNGKCTLCGKAFQTKFQFNTKEVVAIQCSWCKAAYHNKPACFTMLLMKETCPRGILANIIVPPHWIIKLPHQEKFKSSLRRMPSELRDINYVLNEEMPEDSTEVGDVVGTSLSNCPFVVKPTPMPRLKPVLVFINPKSGGNQGIKLLHKFLWLLNPRQVFDLSQGGPLIGLRLFAKVPNLRILACGGDGTAGWIMSVMDSLAIPFAPIAVLPLGTGNDLARTLNWGGGYTDEPLTRILSCVEEGKVVSMDRWSVYTRPIPDDSTCQDIINKPSSSSFSSQSPAVTIAGGAGVISSSGGPSQSGSGGGAASDDKQASYQLPLNVFNNYFSLGADAATALEFHESREANPEKFNSRLKNKMFYAGVGGKDLLKRSWRDLSDFLTLECDGVDMTQRIRELRPHALLFLNIPRYSSGTLPWGSPHASSVYRQQRMDDNYIEVIGLTPATLAALQMGGHGDRICQCQSATLTTNRIIPMQVDGEPCRLVPSVIEIHRRNQANLILKPKLRTSSSVITDFCCLKCTRAASTDKNGNFSESVSQSGNDFSHLSIVGAPTLTLSVMMTPLDVYERSSHDGIQLKAAAQPFSVITVEMNANLADVRQQITQVHQNDSSTRLLEWWFLDTCTTDRYFRVDRSQEINYFVTDISTGDLYIVALIHDHRFSSSSTSSPPPPPPPPILSISIPPANTFLTTGGDDNSISLSSVPQSRRTPKMKMASGSTGDIGCVVDCQELDVPLTTTNQKRKSLPTVGEITNSRGGGDNIFSSDPATPEHELMNSSAAQNICIVKETDMKPSNNVVSSMRTVDRAFMKSCKRNRIDSLQAAVDSGADYLCVDSAGRSGLHWAVKHDNVDVVKYLLEHAPKRLVEIQDYKKKQTALHKAAIYRRRNLCDMLIAAGSSVFTLDADGFTPRQLANFANDNKLVLYFRNKEFIQMMSPNLVKPTNL